MGGDLGLVPVAPGGKAGARDRHSLEFAWTREQSVGFARSMIRNASAAEVDILEAADQWRATQ